RVGIPMVDIGTGMSSAFGIMVALHERQNSGRGQSIDMTLYDTAISLLFPHAANWFLGGKKPILTGNHHPNISPYDTFATKTCDIFIGVGNDGQFKRLCEVLGDPELASDGRFLRNSDRSRNKTILREVLEKQLAEFDGEQISVALMQNGVPAGPVLDVPGALNHAQTRNREMVAELDSYKGLANPIKLSRTPAEVKSAPPQFGEHTISVLSELGYSSEEIENLIRLDVAFTGGEK
ncbi:MAG: CaiB/BaiF CoA transferase family protein, partial [Methyloligellaceae bacterium]